MQASTYTLDHNKLADALSILAGELEALAPLVRIQRTIIARLTKVTYTVFLSSAAVGLLWNHNWVSTEAAIIAFVLLWVAYAVAVFVFGWGELSAWSRLRKAEGRLGLARTKYMYFVGWEEFKTRLPLVVPGLLGTFMLFGLLWSAVFGDLGPWVADVGILGWAVGNAVSANSIMLRNALMPLHRLEVAEHLRHRLLEQQSQSVADENQTFSVSAEEYKQIARMERALISKDRKRAIKQSAKESEHSFRAVQQSPEVLRKKSTLDPDVRLRVQTQIDELSTRPQPPTAYEVDGTWRLPVPESSLEIRYVLEANLRHIMVHDIADAQSTSRLERM